MGLIFHLLQPPLKRPAWQRWTVTVASLSLALLARVWLEPWLLWHSPFALLLPAILASAWYGGMRTGLMATLLGGAAVVLFLMQPAGLGARTFSDGVSLALFLVEGGLVSAVCEVLHLAVERAQRAAHEAAHKFELLANSAPVLIWSTDADGRCVFVNHPWLHFIGRSSDQELGDDWAAHIHAEDAVAHQAAQARARQSRSAYQLEYRRRRADGTYRWLLERAEPRYDRDGRFAGFTASCTDVTGAHEERERERAELEFLARLQRNLASSLDLDRLAGALAEAAVPQLADAFCVELLRDEGGLEVLRTLHAANSADACATPALSAMVLESGEPHLSTQADTALLSGPDEALRQRLEKLGLGSHLAVPLVARGRVRGVLSVATTRDSGRKFTPGDVAFIQKIAAIAGFALDNARLYQRTVRALTAAEQARQELAAGERALHRQRSLLKTIIDALPALVAYVGPDGRILLHNQRYREWLNGSTTDASRHPFASAPGTGSPEIAAAHLRAALAGETVMYEDIIAAAGTERQVAAILWPDRDGKGRVRGVVFHAYDVTDRKRAYAELATARELLRCHADELEERVRQRTATLRETNAELEAFSYSVSHDLRTPLQFVRTYADAIREDSGSSLTPESQDYLARIQNVAQRMDGIIHDLLGYSRLARGELSLVPLPLEEAIAEAVTHHQTAIQHIGAQVIVQSPLPRVLADRVGLFQILTNLLSNSLKFIAPGRPPVIRLGAESGPAFTRLWVSDNGIGIPVRHQERVFKLFERLHPAHEYPGTGIGLALVRKAASRMGGRCGLESEPGVGSRFWIDFPNARDALAAPVGSAAGESPMRN